nr:class I SAM-dependent DNA methyltransferase [Spirulina major]
MVERELAGQTSSRRRSVGAKDYQAKGALYLPPEARYQFLLDFPEDDKKDIGAVITDAIALIEAANEELKGVLPTSYKRLESATLRSLLKTLNFKLDDIHEDAFGEIYQYFLANFSQKEGQKGGEFFTPIAIVRLIVEIIEPDRGRILDPACGAGGMFIQSALFSQRRSQQSVNSAISVYGQEKVEGNVKLCQMNLAVHGISGLKNIKVSNTYYEDIHDCLGAFDFVMANPPFNVNGVDREKIAGDPRYPFGVPSVDNANYLWIELFYAALNEKGRAGFVMANSASDARSSELLVRQKLIEAGAVDVMVAVGSNFFYTVTLPCTLWFLDRGKPESRKDRVLFIDARHIFEQVDRAHREFSEAQIEFIANIVRLYRGEAIESLAGSGDLLVESFPDGVYLDVLGLCKVATVAEIEAQGWSLNPGRYVGVTERVEAEDFDFTESLEVLSEELEVLNSEGRELEDRIAENVAMLLNC